MTPFRFTCRETIPLPAPEIAWQILDVDKWREFDGFGPLPGIEEARFETRTPEIVGSRIAVRNRDGSTHVEEIVEWDPERRVRMEFGEFSPPLSRLAERFVETWEFTAAERATLVVRSFELHSQGVLGGLALRLIAPLLKAAIRRHLRQIRERGIVTTIGA